MVFEDNLDIILPPPHPQSPPVKKYIFCDALLEPLWQDGKMFPMRVLTYVHLYREMSV